MSMNFNWVKLRRIPAGAAFRSCGQVLDRFLSSQMCCCTCWCILVDMLHPCCRKKAFKIQIWAVDDKVAHCLTHTHLSPKYHRLVVKKIMITKSLRNPLKNFANACHEEVLNSSWPIFYCVNVPKLESWSPVHTFPERAFKLNTWFLGTIRILLILSIILTQEESYCSLSMEKLFSQSKA